MAGAEPSAPTPKAAYAMGWFVDTYGGCAQLSHGGYVHDVHSEIMLLPTEKLGIVSFINFGPPMLARLIDQCVFDVLTGREPVESVEEKLARYEKGVENTSRRNASVPRVANTVPSHPLVDYAGIYARPGYGPIEIQIDGRQLFLRRNRLVLPLEHWHYDAWIVRENEMFHIHVPYALDPSNRLLFETNADGQIDAVSIPLEPAVGPIRLTRQRN